MGFIQRQTNVNMDAHACPVAYASLVSQECFVCFTEVTRIALAPAVHDQLACCFIYQL